MLQPAPHFGKFDIILCRNMLMYLGEEKRVQVLDAIASRIADDGILMLGAAETVIGQTEKFKASAEFRGFYEPVTRAATQSLLAQRRFG